MKRAIVTVALICCALVCYGQEKLIRHFGSVDLKQFRVTIDLGSKEPSGLTVRLKFQDAGETGTGADSSIPIVPGKWAAQFVAPNELWIYDGASTVLLYERTISPEGFKASSSAVVPRLLGRAPIELRAIMKESSNVQK